MAQDSAEERLVSHLEAQGYSYNIVQVYDVDGIPAFKVVFFKQKNSKPIDTTITFDFLVGEKILFTTESNTYRHNIEDFESLKFVIDREYEQKLRFKLASPE